MIDCLKLPLSFNPSPLKADLAGIAPDDWTLHFNKSYYEGDWSAVALRSVGGVAGQIYPDPTKKDFADTPVLVCCPNIQEALQSFQCPLQSVRLLKLAPGASIREHKDYNLGYEDGEVRIHIPVQTSPLVEFYLAGRRLLMNEGESWYVNFNLPHRVNNQGDTDRVHLVLDCIVNDWLRSQFPPE
ncbi:MAG: aspartyl/asparaginyl beta-hydroxylase domain-containing protein [Acidobacteria bacterium]|nr:aspartyl/asparaginyl beta-hydroxylase domain-containing protein [Acidobacteriota bacterium]